MKDSIILFLIAIVLALLAVRVVSTYGSPGSSTPSVADVKAMLASGMSKENVIYKLYKDGMTPVDADSLVAQALKT
jgi:hypothetical protein